jgi:UDP-glucose 4-epimerase
MNQIMQHKPMTIYGDGEQVRAFTYISDVAPTIARSINVPEARNQVFNVGSDGFCTENDLAEKLSKAMEARKEVIYLPPRNEVKQAYCTHDKINRIFGYRPTVELEEGLKRMARWAREKGPRRSAEFKSLEIPKNLPRYGSKQY